MRPRILVAACPVVAGALLFFVAPVGAESVRIDDAQMRRLGVSVGRPVPVSEMEVATVPARVVVPPAQQAAVSTPASGLVSRLFVAAGDTIESGDAVAEISSPDFMRDQREFLDALATEELAAAQLERDEGLMAEGIIASRRVQETNFTARAARLARTQAEQQLLLAGLDSAAIDRLTATRELAPTLILRAPFAGIVMTQDAAVGDALEAFDAVIRIADLSRLWLEAHVPQELAERIAPGMQLTTTSGAGRLAAVVTTIGRTVDPDTQSVLVRGSLDTVTALSAGQFLTVTIVAANQTAPVFVVPASAITRSGDGSHLFARSDDGFMLLPVEVVSENGDSAYVRGTLNAAAEIAVDGVSALKALLAAQQELEG